MRDRYRKQERANVKIIIETHRERKRETYRKRREEKGMDRKEREGNLRATINKTEEGTEHERKTLKHRVTCRDRERPAL